MSYKSIVRTILDQLGGNKFVVMTGAKNFISHDNGLSLRFPRQNGLNYLKITLNGMDLYDLEWGYIAKKQGLPTYTKKKVMEDIYADQLQELFTEETGLYTTF